MRSIIWAHGLLIVAALFATSFAQSAAKPSGKAPPAPAKPKLTEKQKQGLRLLDAAETEATALQPDMRAFIEWQVSRGYQKYDSQKSDDLLERAFNSTTAITTTKTGNCFTGKDEACRVKNWLQYEILEEMVKRSFTQVQDLLPKLDPEGRRIVNGQLLDTYLKKRQLDQAKDLLDRWAGEDHYPYARAADLFEAIPESRRSERLALFSQALANFQQFNTDFYPDQEDFATMLVRCWRHLPPSTALNAIDSVLEKTKQDSESDDEFNKYPLAMMTSHHGTLKFNSSYEMRIFELMPILRELDRSRADALLREHADLQETTKQFPNGLFSVDEQFGKQWSEKDEQLPEFVNFAIPLVDETEDREESYLFQQDARIYEELAHDPKEALATAYSLPEVTPKQHHPRANEFMLIADKTTKKDPDVCRTALSEARKAVDVLKPISATRQLLDIAADYVELGDMENARSALLEASRKVEAMYAKDSDASDPNLGFKGNWPSTQFWGRCLQVGSKISIPAVEELIAGIPDPEILSFEKAMFANGLLGVSHGSLDIVELHKDGKYHYMSM